MLLVDMLEENALMHEVQDGSIDKLSILFERYHVPLFHYFIRTGNNHAASEDLVQETFTRVLAYRASFTGSATFKSWLYGIASNVRVDFYRKSKQDRPHVDIDSLEMACAAEPTGELQQQQQQLLFEKALASLDVEQREIIVLSRFANLNYEEIAQMQQCNINTFKSRIRKAMCDLQHAYQQLSGEFA